MTLADTVERSLSQTLTHILRDAVYYWICCVRVAGKCCSRQGAVRRGCGSVQRTESKILRGEAARVSRGAEDGREKEGLG